jgi:antitoxin (DNA-binding transcriptional repressor) of toxin-antitoxin stability system
MSQRPPIIPQQMDHNPVPRPQVATVGVRQLRSDVAAYVRRAESGEQVIISVGGRSVAQIGPLSAPEGAVRLPDLIARGAVLAPRRTGPLRIAEPIPVWSGSRLDRLLREIR